MPLFGRSDEKPEKKTRVDRARTPEAPGPAVETDEQFGLFELWPNTPPGEATRVPTMMDIVAVHGLGGHPYKTWTEGQSLWLRDFLPKDVPDARILTFGYNSSVAFGGTASRLDDFARTLLERLLQKRRQYKDTVRPVIFVCHSLGGIVFKRALVIAHAHSSRYHSLIPAIKSAIFMGTPHRGSDVANWSKILGQIANVPLLGNIRTDLLEDLRPKSELLMTISSDFVERGAGLSIFSIYERKFIPGLRDLIVDKDSAILNQQNETPLPIEADHRTMCKFLTSSSESYATVFDCLSELYPLLTSIKQALADFISIDAAKGEDDSWRSKTRIDFMTSLPQFDHRNVLSQVPRPLQGTCQWIAQDPEFRRWLTLPSNKLSVSEACRVFYMYGSPGVGKTVMSRYIIYHLRQSLKSNDDEAHIVVYFFCDDKDPRRRTSSNLLRSLLFQTLIEDKQLLRYVSEDAIEAHLQKLRNDTFPLDELHDLWNALLAVIQRSRTTRFWFIIDAIDELQPTSRKDVIYQLDRILESDTVGRLKVLFTDRQESKYHFSNQAVLELGSSDSQDDVRTYIRQSIIELSNEIPIESKYKTAIEDEIAMIAHGTFLHASLAFANFTRGVTVWTPRVIKSRLGDLQKLPASLEAYYAGLLRHIPADFQRKARKAFIWVLGSISRAPLTLKEIHYAVSVNEDQQRWSDLKEDLGYNFESSFLEACGYLLKIDGNGFVVFSHQTVKELFESTNTPARETDEEVLRGYRITPKDIDVEIVQACITMLQFEDFDRDHVGSSLFSLKKVQHSYYDYDRDPLLNRMKLFPLLAYAIRYWNYFDNVTNEAHVAKALSSFFRSFQGNYFRVAAGPWTEHTRSAVPGTLGPLPLELPPLHHCVQIGDFPNTVLALMSSGVDVNEMDSEGLSPLHWACARGNEKTIAALLSNPRLNPNSGIPGKYRPIHLALEWLSRRSGGAASIQVPLIVLKDQRTDVNAASIMSETPLHICLRHGGRYTVISDYLLDRKDIDLNAKDKDGNTPFMKAVNRPEHQYIFMKMLKNPNVRLDKMSKNSYSDTISIAGMWGWREVEAALINISVDQVFSIGDDGFNYLTRLAFYGRKQALSRLLDMVQDEGERLRESVGESAESEDRPQPFRNSSRRYQLHPTILNRMPPGSDVHDEYRRFHHLLHLCAQQDWEDIANILEQRFGIHGIPDGDHVGRTMLHWAVENNWDYAMGDFSNKSKPWIDHQDRDGMTALHIACIVQNYQVAEHLVDSGANYLLKDKLGKNPGSCRVSDAAAYLTDHLIAHVAAEAGCRSIIRLFLDESTREYGRDKQGRSLLHFLVMWQPGSLIEDFINTKSPIIDVLDKERRTPLSYAALYNNNEALEVLLRHGAKINLKDSNGSMPLHLALRGSATTASMLIGWGAELKSTDGFGQNCLQIAIRSQRRDTIELILSFMGEEGQRLDRRDWALDQESTTDMVRNKDFHGKSALHRACAAHDFSQEYISKQAVFKFIRSLIGYGALVDAQDKFGYTPAHVAATGNNMPAIDALLDENPDLALLDQHRCTAMDWARAQGQFEMADMLREAGGVSTQDYARKLGAYGSLPPKGPQGPQKQYDMKHWAVMKIESELDPRGPKEAAGISPAEKRKRDRDDNEDLRDVRRNQRRAS